MESWAGFCMAWFHGTSPGGTVPSAPALGNVTKDQAPQGPRNPTKLSHLQLSLRPCQPLHVARATSPREPGSLIVNPRRTCVGTAAQGCPPARRRNAYRYFSVSATSL